MVEHTAHNGLVVGSNPAKLKKIIMILSISRILLFNENVTKRVQFYKIESTFQKK